VAEAVGGACQWVLGGRWMMGGSGSGSGKASTSTCQQLIPGIVVPALGR